MAFEAKDYAISDILNKSVFDIPRNQRRYVWKKPHWQDLYEDIVFSITETKPHFVGSIVLESGGKKDGLSYYTIIDGQQRLTTITIVLLAIMKHFHENDMTDDFLGTISYLQSKNNSNQDITILNSEYHVSLSSLIRNTIALKDKSLSMASFVETNILSKTKDKCVGDALRFFYSAIRDDVQQVDNVQGRLREIRNAVLDMTAVKIVSSSEEDSYTIFEILNARGQELAAHELLKNYIMRYIQPAERRDDARTMWEDMERTVGSSMDKFIKHYATHRFGDTRDKYNSPYQAIQKATHGQKIGELFDDIKLKSEYYSKIIHPDKGEEGNCNEIEYAIFNFFRTKRFEQFRPILLSLIHQRSLGKLSSEKYELTLKYIYNFFVCYTIIGEEKSNKLEDVVFKYARMLEDSYSDELLQEFANNLKRKIPSYEWFLNAFKNVGWSNHYDLYKGEKNKTRVQIILEVIETFESQAHNAHEFTVEHILSDSDGIGNAQIGNLIPLEDVLNRNCANKSFVAKCDFYERSSFTSARGIATRFREKPFDPSKRTEYLAKLMFWADTHLLAGNCLHPEFAYYESNKEVDKFHLKELSLDIRLHQLLVFRVRHQQLRHLCSNCWEVDLRIHR